MPPEIAANVEDAVLVGETEGVNVAEDVKVNGAPEASPTEMPMPQFILAAYFSFVRADGSTGSDRVYIQGVPALRYRAQIEHFEKAILEQSQGQFIKVMITSWMTLEG